MSDTDPSHDGRRMRLPRLSPAIWVLLALAAGAIPWLAMGASALLPVLLP